MNVFKKHSQSGFTLVELLVVLGIISLFVAIAFSSVIGARKNARDKARLSDIKQIELALNLYRTQNGYYPKESDGYGGGTNGEICKDCTFPINDVVRQFLGSIPEDPIHDGSTYRYYYDGTHNCGGNPSQSLLWVQTMETEQFKNYNDTICSSYGSQGGNKTNGFIIVLGQSSG